MDTNSGEKEKDTKSRHGSRYSHVAAAPRGPAVSPRARNSVTSDIALRYFAPPSSKSASSASESGELQPPGALPSVPGPTVHVGVSSSTGMLQEIQIAGAELLAAPHVLAPVGLAPSRVQLHRAQTDNDKRGYGRLWKAGGLDKEMEYVPASYWCNGFHALRKDTGRDAFSSTEKEVVGSSFLENVVVKRVRGMATDWSRLASRGGFLRVPQ